ncbi:MAG: MarR family transcriptional regulator [Lachnospiraceae bacterium]|jgi:DNA-binding MarR family transcriptional regulator|nr:MarR family transcriptional regulator [Lachnospiraceae bacterium]
MNEIKTTVTDQLQRLQMLMHRSTFYGRVSESRTHNPHMGQGRILALLKIKPEISQRDLTYLLGLSKQSIAQVLEKLEKSGYITRETSEDDKRVSIIKLTEEGAKAAESIDEEVPETNKVLEGLSDEELETFSGLLDKLIKAYEEQFPGEDFDKRRKIMEEFVAHHRRDFEKHGDGPERRRDRGEHFGKRFNHHSFRQND